MLKTALNFGVMIIFFPFFSVRVKETEIDSFDRLKKEFDFIRFFFLQRQDNDAGNHNGVFIARIVMSYRVFVNLY